MSSITEIPDALLPAVERILKLRIEPDPLEEGKLKRVDIVMEVTAGGQTHGFALGLTAESFSRGSGIIVPGGISSIKPDLGQS
jgi:hypothetical protein